MLVLVVDNLDSFTHNLAQLLGGLGATVVVRRSDRPAAELLAVPADRVVLSPGPGGPHEAGCSAEVARAVAGRVPLLGVCLGMQVIAASAGGRVRRARRPAHGTSSPLFHDGAGVFRGLPQGFPAGRYHSLAVDASSLPDELLPSAWSGGVLMGLRHARQLVEAVQFHPESILTPHGRTLLANFLEGSGLAR